jgi:hypothetical protein
MVVALLAVVVLVLLKEVVEVEVAGFLRLPRPQILHHLRVLEPLAGVVFGMLAEKAAEEEAGLQVVARNSSC